MQWILTSNSSVPSTEYILSPLLLSAAEQFCLQFYYQIISSNNDTELKVELVGSDDTPHGIFRTFETSNSWIHMSINVSQLSIDYQVNNGTVCVVCVLFNMVIQ